MSRPALTGGRKLEEVLNIRFTPGDLAKLKAAAARDGLPLSAWIRQVSMWCVAGHVKIGVLPQEEV